MRKRKMIKMVAVAACLMAATAYTAKATLVIDGTATWSGLGGPPGGTTVVVAYSVTETMAGGPYTYSYTVTDNAPTAYPLNTFEVNLLPGASSSITSIGQSGSVSPVEAVWTSTGTLVPGGGGSEVFSFVSTLPPTLYTGSALDDGPGNWQSTYGITSTYIASPVPEPTTMIAGALLLLPFGASTLRILRRRTA